MFSSAVLQVIRQFQPTSFRYCHDVARHRFGIVCIELADQCRGGCLSGRSCSIHRASVSSAHCKRDHISTANREDNLTVGHTDSRRYLGIEIPLGLLCSYVDELVGGRVHLVSPIGCPTVSDVACQYRRQKTARIAPCGSMKPALSRGTFAQARGETPSCCWRSALCWGFRSGRSRGRRTIRAED